MSGNKYERPTSAYARREGVWVPGRGVNYATGASIAALIIRDFLRHYTYDSKGRKIPMDETLFRKRLFYLIALCHKHHGRGCGRLHALVNYVYHRLRLPPGTEIMLAGPNAPRVARELLAKGIVDGVVVYTNRGRYVLTRKPRIPTKGGKKPVLAHIR